MKRSLLKHLFCPDTLTPLSLEVTEEEPDRIKTGALISITGERFPIVNYVPRFVSGDLYASSFSFQRRAVRRHFSSYRRSFDLKEASAFFERSTGIPTADLSQKLVLDAGCGYGRFLHVSAAAGAETIGVDLSTDSIELAQQWVGELPNVHLVQADFRRLPFRNCYFDVVFSIGALHQSPDPKQCFLMCAEKLGSGGSIGIWVYHPDMKRSSDRWRRVSTRLPLPIIYGWCVVNEIVFAPLRSLPRGSGIVHRLVPGSSLGIPFWQRVLSDFDDLTPKYAFSYSHEEVERWFCEAGLQGVTALERATSVAGRRP